MIAVSPVMASEIEGDVKKTLLDRSDAEKVFRPWWDTVEDYLLNILIALGDSIYIRQIKRSRYVQ